MHQYPLGLSLPPDYSPAHFITFACNDAAHSLITRWPDWPQPQLLLHGPAGSGKTHLAHLWAARAGARILSLTEIEPLLATSLPAALCVEDIDRAGEHEHTLFHLLNASRSQKSALLLTSRVSAPQLPLALADVRSRLLALAEVGILPPDDDSLKTVLGKHFFDRQLKVEPGLIDYLAARMPRSFEAARQLVSALDDAALARHRAITPALARTILESFESA